MSLFYIPQSGARLQALAPCYMTRLFDQDHVFYAVRDQHFGSALSHYMTHMQGAVDSEESREQILCNMARGLFVANCAGSA